MKSLWTRHPEDNIQLETKARICELDGHRLEPEVKQRFEPRQCRISCTHDDR